MKSIKDKIADETWGGKSREVIPLIYSTLKKRKIYTLFKKNYIPLVALSTPTEDSLLARQGGREIYIPTDSKKNLNEELYYKYPKGTENIVYKGTFLEKLILSHGVLTRSFLSKEPRENWKHISPEAIESFIAQDYFTEYVKTHKVYPNEMFFSFVFGTIGMIICLGFMLLMIKLLLPGFFIIFLIFFIAVFAISSIMLYVKRK